MFYYLGYEKREYKNKEGKDVLGYNLFIAKKCEEPSVGFRPLMRFDSSRKSLGFIYLTPDKFSKLHLDAIKPFSPVKVTFNEFGSVETVSSV